MATDANDNALTIPDGESPVVHRKFQCTEFINNKNVNKYWVVEYFEKCGIQRVTFGRVGVENPPRLKRVTRNQVEKLIESKKKSGYVEVAMHTINLSTTGQTVQCHPIVKMVVEDIMKTAGEAVAKFLTVKVENLSIDQINNARKLLGLAQSLYTKGGVINTAELKRVVQAYYNTIPTKLPSKIKADEVVTDFTQDFGKVSDRLDQLEAQLAQITPTTMPNGTSVIMSAFDKLAQTLTVIDPKSDEYKAVEKQLMGGLVHGYGVKIKHILAVNIEGERKTYEANTVGKGNTRLLWHGTRAANVVHILRTGLKIMNVVANGSMFGRGLYFACQASKSINYISPAQSGNKYVFLHEVALGNQYIAPTGQNFNEAPNGYQSVWGKQGQTKTHGWSTLLNHEYIVYNAAQQTMKYIVVFN